MTASLLFEIDPQHIATLTLNRPAVRNALNWDLMEAFAQTVESAAAEPDLRALILTGAGAAFCAGGDLFELHHHLSRADGLRLADLMGGALARLASIKVPTLAAIEGPAIGGGAEIILACDLRLASHTARIGFPQIDLALIPAWDGVARLAALVGRPHALQLLASGEIISAERSLEIGLVEQVVPAGQALASAREIAGRWAANDPAAMAALMQALRTHGDKDTAGASPEGRARFADLWAADSHRQASETVASRGAP